VRHSTTRRQRTMQDDLLLVPINWRTLVWKGNCDLQGVGTDTAEGGPGGRNAGAPERENQRNPTTARHTGRKRTPIMSRSGGAPGSGSHDVGETAPPDGTRERRRPLRPSVTRSAPISVTRASLPCVTPPLV
jgi:hypothetical protein